MRTVRDRKERIKALVPFGLGQTNPKHFRDMGKILWENRDNLPYAWKVLNQGVCDGCALGVAGLHDWTIDSVHLCMTRLNLLRLNTIGPLDPAVLADVSALRKKSNRELRELGRLPYPMLRRRGEPGFRRISWDEAYDAVVARARDPRRIAFFLTSRALTNETYYVAQKAARLLGTNNIDNAARLCHSPSTGAMKAALGVAASTCSYKDWMGTDLIVFFGSNPANDQPVSVKYLHEAKRLGTRVAMVNPYREPGMDRYWVPSILSSAVFGTDVTDYWYPVTQGGDVAFLYGVIRILIENGWHDREFVRDHCEGFEQLSAGALAFTWEQLEAQSGLPRSEMLEFATLIRDARTAVFVWSMGITQHARGAEGVRMILNLGLLKGFVGREKCGLMPIRGHSGVQGGAEMGAYATTFPGVLPINPENAESLSRQYGFPVPSTPGLTAVDMISAAAQGDLDLLYSVGGNFLRTLPAPDEVERALASVPLRVHQDIIVTDQMLVDPGEEVLLLPARTRYEQEGGGTETTTERRIAFSPQIPRRVGEARSEWKILRDIGLRARPEMQDIFGCSNGQEIRDEIARVVPAYEGIQNLRQTGDAVQYGGPRLCEGGKFPTADGKAHLAPVPLPANETKPGEFFVSTRRGKQFNSLVYGDLDPLNGAARDAVLMNSADAESLRLANNDAVTLVSESGKMQARIKIAPIAPGNLQVHWPEGNVLIPSGICDASGGVPDYNARVRVEVEA